MRRNFLRHLLTLASLSSAGSLLAQAPIGVHPRATPADYGVSQQTRTAVYAASVLPADQVRHIFASNISKSYMVIEIACYPANASTVNLDPADFLVKTGSQSEFIHSADSVTVASVVQQKNTPPSTGRGTGVYTNTEVGYESETDPTTGRRIHGTYTRAGVGVDNGPNSPPLGPPPPGASPQDRYNLEQQLSAAALPSGDFKTPVAGYLYFPAREIEKKNGAYELQYLSDPSGKVLLSIAPVRH